MQALISKAEFERRRSELQSQLSNLRERVVDGTETSRALGRSVDHLHQLFELSAKQDEMTAVREALTTYAPLARLVKLEASL